MHKIEKKKFLLCIKYLVIAETFVKNCVHTIKVNETDIKSLLWIKIIDI